MTRRYSAIPSRLMGHRTQFNQLNRRDFISLLSSTAAAWPLTAHAQQPDQMRLIGVLMAYAPSDGTAQSWLVAFRSALSKLGWIEGSHLRIELRWSADNADRMRALAKELVDLRPNAIFGVTTPVIGALARETKTIPIVFAGVTDPIGSGFAANLAHPGGNITGFMSNDPAGNIDFVGIMRCFDNRFDFRQQSTIFGQEILAKTGNRDRDIYPIRIFLPCMWTAGMIKVVEYCVYHHHGSQRNCRPNA